jgi:hypothetical protein
MPDQNAVDVPQLFADMLGHAVTTAFEMGWAEFSNGNLLHEAEAQFNGNRG